MVNSGDEADMRHDGDSWHDDVAVPDGVEAEDNVEAQPGTTADAPIARQAAGGRGRGRRIVWGVVLASLAILVCTAALVTNLVRTPDQLAPLDVGPTPPGSISASGIGAPAARVSAAASASPRGAHPSVPGSPATAGAPSTRAPSAVPTTLAGRFAIEATALVNYRASVTIDNSGAASVTGWTLVITLPRQTLSITEVAGARASRDGATWTLVPDQSTRQVPGRGSVQVRFRVDGASLGAAPTSCTLDGRACEGLAR